MFDVLDREFDEIKPSERLLSSAYNFTSGEVSEDDRRLRKALNASYSRAAYRFDKSTKAQLRKKVY
jgi:hypothetical protein